jgi:hypothetical protein
LRVSVSQVTTIASSVNTRTQIVITWIGSENIFPLSFLLTHQ